MSVFFIRLFVFLVLLISFTYLGNTNRAFRKIPKLKKRIIKHLLLQIINISLVFVVVPIGLFQVAQSWNGGLLNVLKWPTWIEVFIAVLIFDFIIYWQHRLFHQIPFLWKYHQVHHSDLDMETSTAVRFHPIEIIISLGIKVLAIMLIGPPAIAVLIFEISLNSMALFHHSNFRLPEHLDNWLNKVIITQSQHYVHHSNKTKDMNSNYGFCLAVWDMFFSTRRILSSLQDLHFGLTEYPRDLSLKDLLQAPFLRKNLPPTPPEWDQSLDT